MKRTTITLAILVIALAFATLGVQPVSAAPGSSVAFGAQISNGCFSGNARFLIHFDVADPNGVFTVRTIATAGGLIYMDELFSSGGAFFESRTSWGIFNNNSGGTRNALMPVPNGEPITVVITFDGYATSTVTYTCDFSGAGRPIPDGFVLRTIICEVNVFSEPDGTPVEGARIKNGQTWYVNPESVSVKTNPKYPKWTEIFVSGETNGWIPTACVGAPPAGYNGN
jgi:hypothetical protein